MYQYNFRHYTALLTKNNSLHINLYAASLFFARALSNLETCINTSILEGVILMYWLILSKAHIQKVQNRVKITAYYLLFWIFGLSPWIKLLELPQVFFQQTLQN